MSHLCLLEIVICGDIVDCALLCVLREHEYDYIIRAFVTNVTML